MCQKSFPETSINAHAFECMGNATSDPPQETSSVLRETAAQRMKPKSQAPTQKRKRTLYTEAQPLYTEKAHTNGRPAAEELDSNSFDDILKPYLRHKPAKRPTRARGIARHSEDSPMMEGTKCLICEELV